MNCEPVFKGKWPEHAAQRWTLIRNYLSVWCFGESNFCSKQQIESTPLKSQGVLSTNASISPSLRHWFDVTENYSGENLVIRDVVEVSDLSAHIDVREGEFTVVLMQGEGDVFWTVKNDSLYDDDPQVYTFQNYSSESNPLLGTYPSVSIFALWYFCLYNDVGKNRVDVFCCDLPSNSFEEIFDWFPYRLTVLPANPFCSNLELLEATDCVGILLKDRLTCSLFSAPDQLTLPAILRTALTEAHETRKDVERMLSGKSDDEKST